MKVNYHTHTIRCNHAKGSEKEYVESAIKAGMKELGFADHTPWPYPKYVSPTRMRVEELENYVNTVLSLKEEYKDEIKILLGLEVEYFPKYINFLHEIKNKYPFDYFILGNHFYETDEYDRFASYYGNNCDQDEMMDRYCETTIEAMKTGLFCYVAHPDLFMRGRKVFDEKAVEVTRKICEAALKYNIPLEYNLEGALGNEKKLIVEYPHPAFWQIVAQYKPRVVIGFDAHHNLSLEREDLYDYAIQFLNNLGLEVEHSITTFGREYE